MPTIAMPDPSPLKVLRVQKFGTAICRGDRWRLKHTYERVVTTRRTYLRCTDCGVESPGIRIEG